MAKGYWVARGDVRDVEAYKAYIAANAAPIAKHGGRFLVRGGRFENPEGSSRSRNIVIEFDANAQGPYRFRPTVTNMTVHPGELATVMYEVVNTQKRDVAAQAIPSYAPQNAMQHFKKVECFCFKQQTLKPNEARQMPVVFFIDPALPKEVKTITLSYTFFEVGGMDKTAVNEGSKHAVR